MKKISLKTIQDALSRDEMKVIKGGSGTSCLSYNALCFAPSSIKCCGTCAKISGDWGVCR